MIKSLLYLKLVLSVQNEVWMPRSWSWYCLTMFSPFPLDDNACSIKKWITCIWIYFWVIMFLLSITLSFHRCHSCLIKMALYANLGISCNKYFLFSIALEFVLLFQTESHWVALALAVETRLVLNIHQSFCLSSECWDYSYSYFGNILSIARILCKS